MQDWFNPQERPLKKKKKIKNGRNEFFCLLCKARKRNSNGRKIVRFRKLRLILIGNPMLNDDWILQNNAHFEWVTGFEDTIKGLAVDVFDTIGVKDDNALNVTVKGLDGFQENLKTKMDQLVEMVKYLVFSHEGFYHIIEGMVNSSVETRF